jgi:glycosyltransferase involved in cell wall biosynthesis
MLGMVLLEAMRHRKPVIATRVGGTTDIVRNDETGILIPQRDPQALAEAIGRLLDEPERAERLGRAGYSYAHDQFSWQAVLNQTLALYGLIPAAGLSE